MADPESRPAVPATSDPLAGLAALAQTLGGKTTTTNPGDVTALQQAIAALQGQDNAALLQSIFQKATQEIPNLQSSMGRALGARSRNNSALAGALQNLLKDTTVTAQDQLVKQQLANLQAQVQAGAQVANTTRGTSTTEGTNIGAATKNLAILTALNKLIGKPNESIVDTIKSIFGGSGGGAQDFTAPDASSTPAIDMTGFSAPATTSYSSFAPAVASWEPMAGTDVTAGGYLPQTPQYTDMTGFVTPAVQPDWAVSEPVDMTGFIVPNQSTNFLSEPTPAPWEPSFTDDYSNYFSFADGGLVRASGGRRSAAPTVAPMEVTKNQAKLSDAELAGIFGTQSILNPTAPVTSPVVSNPIMPTAPSDTTGGDGGIGGTGTTDTAGGGSANIGGMLSTAAGLSNLSGLTGGPSIPGIGTIAGLANAQSPGQALGVVGTSALNMAAPGAGSLLALGMNPSQINAVNLATSLNPTTAAVNAALGLFGTSIGSLALGSPQSVAPNGDVTEATGGLFGAGGQFGGEPAMSSPVTGPGSVETTDLGMLGPDTTGFSDLSFGDVFGGGSEGAAADVGGGASDVGAGSDIGGGEGWKNGGPVNGPGTGTSDSIKARLSDGEFVISADVVEKLGEDFFHQLQATFHTPAAMQKRAW